MGHNEGGQEQSMNGSGCTIGQATTGASIAAARRHDARGPIQIDQGRRQDMRLPRVSIIDP